MGIRNELFDLKKNHKISVPEIINVEPEMFQEFYLFFPEFDFLSIHIILNLQRR